MNALWLLATCTAVAQNSQPFTMSPGDSIGKYFQQTADGGRIEVATTKKYADKGQQILLTKTNSEGNEEWYQFYGGRSYDKAGSVRITKDGGYIIVGSTSSYGKGNYDVFMIKTDIRGKKQWSKTFGGFYNEYGNLVAQTPDGGFIIKGKKQTCDSNTDFQSCVDNVWLIKTNSQGEEEWDRFLTE